MEKFHTMTPEQRAPIFQNILIWCAACCPVNMVRAYNINRFFEKILDRLKLDGFDSFINCTHTIEHVQNTIIECLFEQQSENLYDNSLPISFSDCCSNRHSIIVFCTCSMVCVQLMKLSKPSSLSLSRIFSKKRFML